MRSRFNSGRAMMVFSALVTATLLAASAMAQEDTPDKGGGHHRGGHFTATGPVTIASTNCPTGTSSGDTCYTITSNSLNVPGIGSGTLTGNLTAQPGTAHNKNETCYPVSSNNETLKSGSHELILSFAGMACVNSKSNKNMLPNSTWTTNSGSPDTGTGKENWSVTPSAGNTSADPLAGTGKIAFNGSATGP